MNSLTRFLIPINDPLQEFQLLCNRICKASSPHFLLCSAGTEVSDRDGISAAGSTPEARRLTPAIDAEALVTGRTLSASSLPVSPTGIVSPVVITRSALQLCGIASTVADCGSFAPPAIPHLGYPGPVACCPSTGRAMPAQQVVDLFEHGRHLGARLAQEHDVLIIGECVPGGTTTALGVLTALGVRVDGLVSSSLPVANYGLREQIIKEGLTRAKRTARDYAEDPLLAVAAVGDPMQPFAAGVTMEAAKSALVVLAGGSQMLAVHALVNAIRATSFSGANSILVATTKWVAFDPAARSAELSRLTTACFVAACPDFKQSRHAGLRAYEDGHVKEGVGAGASMAVANMRGFSAQKILTAIDNCYDEIVLGKIANLS